MKMVNKRLSLVIVLLGLLLISMGFASAAAVINSVSVNGTNSPDNFFSNFTGNNIVNIIANVSGTNFNVTDGGFVKANFTALGNPSVPIDCGSGVGEQIMLSNVTYHGDIFNGSCNVGDEATLSDFVSGPVMIIVKNSSGGGTPDNQTARGIVLYNMTTPRMPPEQICQKFGPLTTDFTSVLDFVRVNFIVHIQNNFTCMIAQMGISGPSSLSTAFLDVMIMNMTSVDLSTPEQAQLLAQLPSYLTLNISQPKVFPSITKIFVNGTAFTALNTNTSIKLLNLPFTTKPNVSSNNLSELVNTTWDTNGYDTGFQVVTGNLTINVLGFTEYNATDIVAPSMTMITPGLNSYNSLTSVVINVSINGTGTELSKVIINITNSSGQQVNFTRYTNSSDNTANCINTTLGGEFYYCSINVTLAADKIYNVNITAWDYGGASPGNAYQIYTPLTVDTATPVVTLISPDNEDTWDSSNDVPFKFNVSDVSIANCSLIITGDATEQETDTSIIVGTTQTINHDLDNGDYTWKINCTDYLGRTGVSLAWDLTVDYTAEDSGDGAGAATTSFWTNSYSPTTEQLQDGFNKGLKKGERIRIKIGTVSHYVGIIKLTSTSATINVSSDPQQAVFSVGETKSFEVTGDDYYDIKVKLNSVNSTSANVTTWYVYEKMPAGATTGATTTTTGAGNESVTTTTGSTSATFFSKITKNKWFWIGLGVVVLAVVGIIYYLQRRKRTKGY